mgnify:CR=1 FL=1
MTSTDNLIPWESGQSGNPIGKSKGTLNRSTVLKRYLSARLPVNPSDIPFELDGKITVEEAIALALIKKALTGDIAAIKEVQDTVYGKIVDKSELSHSYTQMGYVLIGQEGCTQQLTFDVGSEALPP